MPHTPELWLPGEPEQDEGAANHHHGMNELNARRLLFPPIVHAADVIVNIEGCRPFVKGADQTKIIFASVIVQHTLYDLQTFVVLDVGVEDVATDQRQILGGVGQIVENGETD